MSDSEDDKSPRRRDKQTEKPSEDSNSSNKPMDVDPSETPAPDSSKPEEEDASASKARDRLSIQPPDSYGGARPKVFPKKKEDGTKKSSDIPISSNLQRASEVLEATVCRQRELFRRRREDAKKVEEPVSRFLGPGWINAAAEERPPSVSSATQRLRALALNMQASGRYHTEQELQTARRQMEEFHVTEEEFLQMYHIVRRNYEQDEGCCDEFSEVVDRILALLESIELMTSAMLYMDIWLNRKEKEEADLKKKVRKLLRATMDEPTMARYLHTSEADKDKQETDPSTSTESSAHRSDSAIAEDCPSKSEEKTSPYFFESMREYVNLERDDLPRHLTLETRPPSVLSSSDKSSTPTPPPPVEIASPSPEGATSPDNASPVSEEAEVDAKMKVCVLVPVEQVSVEGSIPSSEKLLKLSPDQLTDTPPKSPIKVPPRIALLRETDSPDNTSENVSPIPADSPDAPELEEDSLQVNADRFHIVPHVLVSTIMVSIMNAAREELIALPLGNVDVESVAEQEDERAETPSTDSSGKRKVHQTDSDEESSKKTSKKRHME
ncbi:uncharacterized protein TNIN_152361 [Trichonephila inaurata madagascariensis]|uniref:Uncharacterized protein n=1 Tax=Trichonephila inaurata madagascariensis TaxID=2747483 RepID=A0A8X6YB45_9ARAC|nr:uncharacterized protein TNIN_152361 [Trichonephila inaurata madagascariensis]